MTRVTAVGLAALLVVLAVVGIVATRHESAAAPIYSPAQVKAELLRRPAAWAGRIVLVRGTLIDARYSAYMPTSSTLAFGRGRYAYHELRFIVLVQPLPAMPLPHASPFDVALYALATAHPAVLAVQPPPASPFRSLLSLLRGVPFIGRLIPTPPSASIRTAVYRLKILLPGQSCSPVAPICYDAVLLDALP